MKILLIFPPSTIYGKDPTIPAIVPPLGLVYIAAYLEKHGYDVEVLDARSHSKDRILQTGNDKLFGLTDKELHEYIVRAKPDVVGISCMYTAYAGDVHRVARIVKDLSPTMPVVMGGAHASTFPELVLSDPNIDVVVHAEGEATFLELIQCIESQTDYLHIQGISYYKDARFVKTEPRPFIEDLDTIPFPARHLLDMELYIAHSTSPYTMRAPATTIITSRGCPQSCIYCTIQSVWGHKRWRGRSPEKVVDEIEFLKDEYGVQEFHWLDDSAGASKKRLLAICDEIIRRDLNIKWTTPNGIAHWTLDEEVLDRMKNAGCYRVTFGIESGNLDTRKFLGKPYPLEQAQRMIRYANRIGMWTICTNIIGFPYETRKSIMDTIEFNCRSGTDMAVFYMLCPHPGTEIYEIFKTEGLLNLDHYLLPSRMNEDIGMEELALRLAGRGAPTKYFTPDELHQLAALGYKKFFKSRLKLLLNPLPLFYKIHSLEDFVYVVNIIKIGLKALWSSLAGKVFFSQDMWEHRKKENQSQS